MERGDSLESEGAPAMLPEWDNLTIWVVIAFFLLFILFEIFRAKLVFDMILGSANKMHNRMVRVLVDADI